MFATVKNIGNIQNMVYHKIIWFDGQSGKYIVKLVNMCQKNGKEYYNKEVSFYNKSIAYEFYESLTTPLKARKHMNEVKNIIGNT